MYCLSPVLLWAAVILTNFLCSLHLFSKTWRSFLYFLMILWLSTLQFYNSVPLKVFLLENLSLIPIALCEAKHVCVLWERHAVLILILFGALVLNRKHLGLRKGQILAWKLKIKQKFPLCLPICQWKVNIWYFFNILTDAATW